MWALDFQFDTTTDGRVLKPLHVVDEHTREALAIAVADHTVSVLERIVRERARPPELVRMDNGLELTANALRDWYGLCGSGACYIEPGSPWDDPFVESLGSVRAGLVAFRVVLSLASRGDRYAPKSASCAGA